MVEKCVVENCVCSNENDVIHRHHIIPTYLLGEQKRFVFIGSKEIVNSVFLCKKHHDMIHHMLEKKLFQWRLYSFEEIKKNYYNFTTWFLKNMR